MKNEALKPGMLTLRNIGRLSMVIVILTSCVTTSFKIKSCPSVSLNECKIHSIHTYSYGANYSKKPSNSTFVIHAPDTLVQLKDVVIKRGGKDLESSITGVITDLDTIHYDAYKDMQHNVKNEMGKTLYPEEYILQTHIFVKELNVADSIVLIKDEHLESFEIYHLRRARNKAIAASMSGTVAGAGLLVLGMWIAGWFK